MLSSKAFTRIQRFVYSDLLVQQDFTCPEGMTWDDVGRQCFPVSCYGGMVMHYKYNMKNPAVIVGHALLHDGGDKVRGNPHAMVYYDGHFVDFTDLTRNIQYPETDVVWDVGSAIDLVNSGADHILSWLSVDSIYRFSLYEQLYSGALEDIKKWRPRSTPTRKPPRKLQLDRGSYVGSLGSPPDTRKIKIVGDNNAKHLLR